MGRPSSRTLLLIAALGSVAAGGVALASGSEPVTGDDLRSPGSIPIDESTLPDDEAAEQAVLDEMATLDRVEAEAPALESIGGGAVLSSELDDEDGYVVWEVEVRHDDGSVHEVTVDAGDGRVLGSELER